jgi:hypothetical protein
MIEPGQKDTAKQGAVAKRLVDRYGTDAIRLAIRGMGHLFPYSRGHPWDLFDLERQFLKAAHALVNADPEFRAQRERDEILKAIQEAST